MFQICWWFFLTKKKIWEFLGVKFQVLQPSGVALLGETFGVRFHSLPGKGGSWWKMVGKVWTFQDGLSCSNMFHVFCGHKLRWSPIFWIQPPPIVARWIWWPPSCGAGPELKIPKSMVLNKCVHIYIWTFIRIYIYIHMYICTLHCTYVRCIPCHSIPSHYITLPYIQMHIHIDIYTYTCLQHN